MRPTWKTRVIEPARVQTLSLFYVRTRYVHVPDREPRCPFRAVIRVDMYVRTETPIARWPCEWFRTDKTEEHLPLRFATEDPCPTSGIRVERLNRDDGETRTYQDERPTTSPTRDRPRDLCGPAASFDHRAFAVFFFPPCRFSPTAVGTAPARETVEMGTGHAERGRAEWTFPRMYPACPVGRFAGKPTEFDLLRSRDTAGNKRNVSEERSERETGRRTESKKIKKK